MKIFTAQYIITCTYVLKIFRFLKFVCFAFQKILEVQIGSEIYRTTDVRYVIIYCWDVSVIMSTFHTSSLWTWYQSNALCHCQILNDELRVCWFTEIRACRFHFHEVWIYFHTWIYSSLYCGIISVNGLRVVEDSVITLWYRWVLINGVAMFIFITSSC